MGKLNVTRIWKNFGIGSAAKICPMSESSHWRTLSCIAPMSVLPTGGHYAATAQSMRGHHSECESWVRRWIEILLQNQNRRYYFLVRSRVVTQTG